MPGLRKLQPQLLEEGVDGLLDEKDVDVIHNYLLAAGGIDWEDMKALVEFRSAACVVCPAFDEMFFPAFKTHLLADGVISDSERFYVLKTLYADGKIDANERRFMQELKQDLRKSSPEFDALYAQVMSE